MIKTNKKEAEKLKETEINILQSFFPKGKDITLKEIMKKANYSYEPTYRTLKELTKKRIINVKKFGKTLVYSLDLKRESSKIAFYLYSKNRLNNFKEKHFTILSALSELPEDKVDILALFGSYAKGNERENSDIDLLCVTPEKKELKNTIYSLKRSYNLDFSPILLPKIEFAKIKKENKEFWADLVEYGIIFKGYELFYYYAYLAGEK
jgi:predicted nucleotidyltransferase